MASSRGYRTRPELGRQLPRYSPPTSRRIEASILDATKDADGDQVSLEIARERAKRDRNAISQLDRRAICKDHPEA
jgi:hypothetical protein